MDANFNKIYSIIINQIQGETKGSYNLGNEAALIVKERYSFRNSNQMSISIMLHKKGEQTEMVVVSSGSSQGWLLKMDWGAGKAYLKEVINVLDKNYIRYERTS